MNVYGVDKCLAAMQGIVMRSNEAAIAIIRRAEAALEGEIKKSFTLAHQRGTPTPSAPGEAPAVITGTLRRSIRSTTPEPLATGGAKGMTYPTAVYARIQELGGFGLPARPYVQPSHDRSKEIFRAIAEEEWRRSTRA